MCVAPNFREDEITERLWRETRVLLGFTDLADCAAFFSGMD